MSSVAALVMKLQKEGVTLFREGNAIRYRTVAAPPTEAAILELSRRRDEVFLYFQARDLICPQPVKYTDRPPVPSLTQEIWWKWIDRDNSLTLSLIEFVKDGDAETIEEAIRAIVARHEALRSRFREEGGILTVAYNSVADFHIENQTLAHPFTMEGLKACIDEFAARPLLPGADWMIRAKIVTAPGYGHVAVIIANHMVVDGTSIDILRAELRRSTAKLPRPTPILPERGFSHNDFAYWQRECFTRSGSVLSDYWRVWMVNQPELISPRGRVSLRWRPGKKVRRSFLIPSFAHLRLVEFARRHATFPSLIYLTILALSVMRWSGQGAFPLRCICDARVLPEFSSIVGLMTGADAIGVRLNSGDDFVDSLRQVEAEFHAATRLRLPNIYAVAPFATQWEPYGQRRNIGIVMNYRKSSGQNAGTVSPWQQEVWPPPEGRPKSDDWPHDVSPVCLELTQLGTVTTAAFLLHEDLLTPTEQDGLIEMFFAVFRDALMRET